MTVSFNPSGLINSLEYNLHKGVSRSKTDNQKQIEVCIIELDKISEQKSSAYRKEAMYTVAFAVFILAAAVMGVAIEQKSTSFQAELNGLECRPRPWLELDTSRIETLESNLKLCTYAKACFNGGLSINKLSEAYSHFAKISHNQLDHNSQKKHMRLQQLNQEQNNSSTQSLLNDVKEMKRRQQRAKEAAG